MIADLVAALQVRHHTLEHGGAAIVNYQDSRWGGKQRSLT